MTPGVARRPLLGALVLLALGGFLLHYRVHPFLAPDPAHPGGLIFRGSYVAATLLALLDVAGVTLLFSSRRTAVYGYVLNGLLVIYGTVLMAHFSIATLLPKHPVLLDWALKTTLPDIAIAWADFLVGKALYEAWLRET